MEKRKLEKGDIVQINPERKEHFGGKFLIVTDPKSWGCQGYIIGDMTGKAVTYKGKAYLRIKYEDIEYVGKLVWEEVEKDEE